MIKDRKNVIAGGSTGIIELLSSGDVCKSAYPDEEGRKQSLRDIEREFQIYQRIGIHERFLRMKAYSPDRGLTLEYMPDGNLRQQLRKTEPTILQRLQWAHDAAEALEVLHSHNVIHCDVNPENFLLDSTLRLRIIDFSGSSMDGKWASALESIRFCLPRPWEEQSTVITDLFALGSTIYEIMTSGKPYENLPDDEVESRYRQGIFPNVKTICCGEVIESCWRAELVSAAEVMRSIRTVTDMLRRESIDLEYISA